MAPHGGQVARNGEGFFPWTVLVTGMGRESLEVRTSARFRGTAAQMGFDPPPVALRLRLLEAASHWSLYLQQAAPGPVGPIVDWLTPAAPLRIEFGSRRVLRADFDPIPPRWHAAFRALDVDSVLLAADGSATASVSGARSALAAFAARLDVKTMEMRQVADDIPLHGFLTRAQDEALRAAVEAGYYEIPRPVNLHQLSKRLDISCSSLSERLRRAEGRIIGQYVNEGGRSPWDRRTLYDPYPEDRT